MRWPHGIRCPVCGCDKVSKITRKMTSKNKRTRIYQCLEETCKQQFSATSGTIFNDRIRKAMEKNEPANLDGIVGVDETYIGGKHRKPQGISEKGFQGRSTQKKSVVIGLRQRGGPVKMVHVIDAKSETIRKVVEQHVCDSVEVILTDDYRAYPIALKRYKNKHLSINHSAGYYVTGIDGEIHTNTVESAFSLLKRAIIGNFHAVSIKHLHRYLSEFETRFNARKAEDRFNPTLRAMLEIDAMPYAELTAGE
jgi:transposase-like protein